jgi:DNA-binding NarL/FixJ family response regulator
MSLPIKATHVDTQVRKARVRIMIAESDPGLRYGLKQSLQLQSDFDVVAEAGDGRTALRLIRELDPDVLLVDLRLTNFDGHSSLEELRRNNARTKVIVLTSSHRDNDLALAMMHGCSGVILKQTAPALFVKSVRKAYAGEIWLDPHIMAAAMRQSQIDTGAKPGRGGEYAVRALLSSRERQIVALVAQGHTNKEIGEELFLSEQTIKRQLRIILEKLDVSDRLELTLQAIHMGWLRTLNLEPAS